MFSLTTNPTMWFVIVAPPAWFLFVTVPLCLASAFGVERYLRCRRERRRVQAEARSDLRLRQLRAHQAHAAASEPIVLEPVAMEHAR